MYRCCILCQFCYFSVKGMLGKILTGTDFCPFPPSFVLLMWLTNFNVTETQELLIYAISVKSSKVLSSEFNLKYNVV